MAGCASVLNSSSSDVTLRTSPDKARCELSGHDDFAAVVNTPATLTIPHAAAPVTVACQAPGFRRTVTSLNATSSGWVWGNSALVIVTGGAAALGLVVDGVLGSDWTYPKDMSVDLDVERTRLLRARSRDGSQDLRLEAH